MPVWSMIAGIHLETSFRRACVGRPTFIRRAAVNNSYGVLYDKRGHIEADRHRGR